MKFLLALALLVAAACQTHAALASSRLLPSADLERSLLPALMSLRPSDARCKNETLSCDSCSTVTQCAYLNGGYTYIRSTLCPDSKPYCSKGTCVTQSDECGLPPRANRFMCTEDGYHPDPRDCSKYYVCWNLTPYVYNCPKDHIYDHLRSGCVRQDVSPDSCYVFPCRDDVIGEYLFYKPDPTVYAVCMGWQTILVSKCPDGYRIDPSNPAEPCQPFCTQQGRIADAEDSRAYWDCNLAPNDHQGPNCTHCSAPGVLSDPVKQYCPVGVEYSALQQRCVVG